MAHDLNSFPSAVGSQLSCGICSDSVEQQWTAIANAAGICFAGNQSK
ncbi:hypothetical protein ACPOL_0629 [Acidisarcina polymorpha]|uniref:Uncharacterized protein n=1 Tax=Acidisarcina polymorpha TaxID=2211140 RepID=A0A2Z5FT52_9BACT|nr:hypothetical protein ACPOL_0629 [Acidisarcina polymorpha]